MIFGKTYEEEFLQDVSLCKVIRKFAWKPIRLSDGRVVLFGYYYEQHRIFGPFDFTKKDTEVPEYKYISPVIVRYIQPLRSDWYIGTNEEIDAWIEYYKTRNKE